MNSITSDGARLVIDRLENLCIYALVEDCGLNDEAAKVRLDSELNYYRNLRLQDKSTSELFRRLCISLANRGSLWNLIYGNKFDELDPIYGAILSNYDPNAVVSLYESQEAELLKKLIEARKLSREQTERQLQNPRAQFPFYVKGILAGAIYFRQFKDGSHFRESFEDSLTKPELAIRLPNRFAALGIPGLGPALAGDFLKEAGVKELGKPDRWVIRCMQAAGWISNSTSEHEVQRVFWQLWELLGDAYPPVITDKLMFLVGSGKFVMGEPVYQCNSRFSVFERLMNSDNTR